MFVAVVVFVVFSQQEGMGREGKGREAKGRAKERMNE